MDGGQPTPLSSLRLATTWFRSRVLQDQAARWNHQYATGRWEKLKSPAERARFDATAQLLAGHAPAGEILEIGCGEALLQQRMAPGSYRHWLGVDLSAVAIERANAFSNGSAGYVVADMENFAPVAKFDAVVFTESIYYSADSGRLLQRYGKFLKPGGVFVVSIFQTKRSPAVWEKSMRSPASSTLTAPRADWGCGIAKCSSRRPGRRRRVSAAK